jgi:hypothetical protein
MIQYARFSLFSIIYHDNPGTIARTHSLAHSHARSLARTQARTQARTHACTHERTHTHTRTHSYTHAGTIVQRLTDASSGLLRLTALTAPKFHELRHKPPGYRNLSGLSRQGGREGWVTDTLQYLVASEEGREREREGEGIRNDTSLTGSQRSAIACLCNLLGNASGVTVERRVIKTEVVSGAAAMNARMYAEGGGSVGFDLHTR